MHSKRKKCDVHLAIPLRGCGFSERDAGAETFVVHQHSGPGLILGPLVDNDDKENDSSMLVQVKTWGWTPCLSPCRGTQPPRLNGLHYRIY